MQQAGETGEVKKRSGMCEQRTVSSQDAERPTNLELYHSLVFHFSLFLAFPLNQTHSVHLTYAME